MAKHAVMSQLGISLTSMHTLFLELKTGALVRLDVETKVSDALALALRDGLYRRDDATEFDFDTYGDSIEELRDFILANWRDTAIAADTIARARSLSGGGRRPRVRERVSISRLAPLSE